MTWLRTAWTAFVEDVPDHLVWLATFVCVVYSVNKATEVDENTVEHSFIVEVASLVAFGGALVTTTTALYASYRKNEFMFLFNILLIILDLMALGIVVLVLAIDWIEMPVEIASAIRNGAIACIVFQVVLGFTSLYRRHRIRAKQPNPDKYTIRWTSNTPSGQ